MPGPAQESPVAALSAITAERSRTGPKVQRRKPKLWVILGLTWGTLGLLVLAFWFAWHAGWISHQTQENILKNSGVAPTGSSDNVTSTASGNPADMWLAERNKEVDNAVAVRDYAKAIEVCEAIRAQDGRRRLGRPHRGPEAASGGRSQDPPRADSRTG